MNNDCELNKLSAKIRFELVKYSCLTKTPHLASCLSGVDLLVNLYWKTMHIDHTDPSYSLRDKFFLGKGHAAMLLYCVLANRGFFPVDELKNHGKDNSILEEHPGFHAPKGVEHVSGSLGHALGLAVGNAIAAKLKNMPNHHYILLGDGECNEGSIWEAAMMAPAQRLDNLTVIVDFNKLQGTGRSCEIMHLEPFHEKWRAFGWHTVRVDGHNLAEIETALSRSNRVSGMPTAIIADTIKGKGISFMEDDNNWHYRIPTVQEVEECRLELGVVEQ